MQNDNTTPISANDYDQKINQTIPYYAEFYKQTIDLIEQCNYPTLDWLDLGCGTGTLEKIALNHFPKAHFVLVDPSSKMLDQAKEKLMDYDIDYYCQDSTTIHYSNQFNIITAIQSHHYMQKDERKKAVENVYQALQEGGIFISFENVIPEDHELLSFELLRWGRYQQRMGKTKEQAREHNTRCGVNYFPLTVSEHIQLLKDTGFKVVYVFWKSYMQMGILGIK